MKDRSVSTFFAGSGGWEGEGHVFIIQIVLDQERCAAKDAEPKVQGMESLPGI